MSPEAFSHYKTDIAEIDKQHLDIINKAGEIIRNKNLSLDQLTLELKNLSILFISHLDYEEQLMRQINYKYLIPHIEAHKRLKSQFDRILENLKKPGYSKTIIIVKLDKILLDHVDHDDRQYIEYYAKYLEMSTVE